MAQAGGGREAGLIDNHSGAEFRTLALSQHGVLFKRQVFFLSVIEISLKMVSCIIQYKHSKDSGYFLVDLNHCFEC